MARRDLAGGGLMRLALGSAAAPDAALGDLLEAAARRGLAGLELEEGHGHGLDPLHGPANAAADAAADAATRAAKAGIALAGFRLAAPCPVALDGTDDGPDVGALVRFSAALGAPVLVPCGPAAETDEADSTDAADAAVEAAPDAIALVGALRRAGADTMAVLPAADPIEWLRRLSDDVRDAPVAWDADPSATDLAGTGAALVREAGRRLRHIRLYGGGPEATEQEGRGIGSLMTRLAVLGYGGTVALVPSSPRYRVIWDAWLGRRGGWGCGSKDEDRTLVSLGGVA